MFENDDYIVWKNHPFRIRLWAIGTYFIFTKETSAWVKVTRQEKYFLVAVAGELAGMGLRPPSAPFDELFEEFITAVLSGGLLWTFFFEDGSPIQKAMGYAAG